MIVRGLVCRKQGSEKHEHVSELSHLQHKHMRLPGAERNNDVDARSVVVVEAFPLLVDVGRRVSRLRLCLVLFLQPAVAEVELVPDLLVQPGLEGRGHMSTRLGRA